MEASRIAWIDAHKTLNADDESFCARCDELSRVVYSCMESHPCWDAFMDFRAAPDHWQPDELLTLFMSITSTETAPPGKILVYSGAESRRNAENFVIRNPEYAIFETTAAGAMLFEANLPDLKRKGRLPETLWLAPGYIGSALLVAGAGEDIYTFNNCNPEADSTFRLWEMAYILCNASIENFLHPRTLDKTAKVRKASEATGNLDRIPDLGEIFRSAATPDRDGLLTGLSLSAERRNSYLFARKNLPPALSRKL